MDLTLSLSLKRAHKELNCCYCLGFIQIQLWGSSSDLSRTPKFGHGCGRQVGEPSSHRKRHDSQMPSLKRHPPTNSTQRQQAGSPASSGYEAGGENLKPIRLALSSKTLMAGQGPEAYLSPEVPTHLSNGTQPLKVPLGLQVLYSFQIMRHTEIFLQMKTRLWFLAIRKCILPSVNTQLKGNRIM